MDEKIEPSASVEYFRTGTRAGIAMARIFGLVGNAERGQNERLVRGMLLASRFGYVVDIVGAKRTATAGPGRFGKWTCETRACTMDGNISVVVDGPVFNGEEPGFSADETVRGIVCLYRERGFWAMLERLNGGFALVLYDHDARMLFVARDRLGYKPLYYATAPGVFAFAARLRALATLQNCKECYVAPGVVIEDRARLLEFQIGP